MKKCKNFYLKTFSFWVVKFSIYLNRRVLYCFDFIFYFHFLFIYCFFLVDDLRRNKYYCGHVEPAS